MKTLLCSLYCISTVCLSGVEANESDEARAVIKRAVAAYGGKEKLARLLTRKSTTKGVLYSSLDENKTCNYTSESWTEVPDRTKKVMHINLDGRNIDVVMVLNGGIAWKRMDGRTRRLSEDDVKAFQN